MHRIRIGLTAAGLLLVTMQALAHKPSDSYLTLAVADAIVQGRWDIALRDLDNAIGLDVDGDGDITWGELRARHDAVNAYALSRLSLGGDGRDCAPRVVGNQVDYHSDGAYAVLRLVAECERSMRAVELGYELFFDLDAQHRGLVQLIAQGDTRSTIFTTDERSKRLALGQSNPWGQLFEYVREGIWHIWIGFDHVLFLVTLLLPSVLRRDAHGWSAAHDLRDVLKEVVVVVTAFTVAHSLTLTLAVLDVISLPSRLVESVIAGSVVVAALNNVFPVVRRRLWLLAFGFGLIHGLGFASVLADLGLTPSSLVRSLLGFNLGVELGQLGIVAAVVPIAFWLRHYRLYPRLAVQLGSAVIVALGTVWLVERAFDVAPLL